MSISPRARLARKAVFALCFGLCGAGIGLMAEWPSSFGLRMVALGLMMLAVVLSRSRWAHPGAAPRVGVRVGPRTGWPGPWWWFAGVVLVVGALVSYVLMFVSQAHGGYVVWPLFAFAGFILAGATVWGILVNKLVRRWWGG